MSEEAAIAATVARRAPAQQRSRERLERILAVASDLIARKGSDQMKMSEIADLAGISIGSLYQYFPDKSAIIRTLAERFNGESRKCIEAALADVRGLDGLLAAYSGLVDQYYQIFLAEPVMRDIWSGMQVDRQLAEIELAESRAAGALLAAAMMRIRPDSDPERTASTAFLIWHLGEATMRLAVSYDAVEGAALVDDFKRMTVRELATPRD
ncbi:transcriptional regulator [Caulobacter sp. AP07]|uniref:TetR/AcrR family transcriptional regulator n=1 Tax=Caulobacter sp. AP07 TaxID=1144304 RepID=UPI000271E46E|nr:TetR/AcrR family transcriptional regulator [Caulobacter sp. AP07]EJL20442.1 transcriptional regulator [Caulobacter sp. AP07]